MAKGRKMYALFSFSNKKFRENVECKNLLRYSILRGHFFLKKRHVNRRPVLKGRKETEFLLELNGKNCIFFAVQCA